MTKKYNWKKFKKALIEIRPSKILKGEIGVFAIRNLKKGTIIGESKCFDENLFFSWKDYKKIDKKSKKVIQKYCTATADGFYSPSNINYISIPWNLNHSCEGNSGFDSRGNLITIRDIKSNEELCYDYGLVISNPSFKMRCKCGSPNCRKIVNGSIWKNVFYRKANFNFMAPELRKLVKEKINEK